jgi:Ca-activated chloride channel homolog
MRKLMSPAPEASVAPARSAVPVFSGQPGLVDGEAVLFDSASSSQLPKEGTLTGITLRFPGGAPGALDPELALWIFVDDLAAPRARVRLADLVRQGGRRPLNLQWSAGSVVRITLVDPRSAWSAGAPKLEVGLTG